MATVNGTSGPDITFATTSDALDIINGLDGGDTLYGGSDAGLTTVGTQTDSLYGGDGADLLYGFDGNDSLFGDLSEGSGNGNDRLFGGAGVDLLAGGNADDTASGGSDSDLVRGNDGNDTLDGNEGSDTVDGGAHNDTLYGGAGADADLAIGGAGTDTIYGGGGGDLLIGDIHNGTVGSADRMSGEDGADLLVAGADNDTLYGSAGADWLEGQDGNDTIDGGTEADAALGGAGADTAWGGAAGDYASGGDGNDRLAGGDGEDWLEGGAGADLMFGGKDNDVQLGGTGNDIVEAGAGNDIVAGEDGADLLSGGGGDDVIEGDAAFGVAGNDTLYGGDGLDMVFGGAGDDRLSGGPGDDLLSGASGNDTFEGGAGNDLVLGDAGNDTVVYAGTITVVGSSGDASTVNAGADGIDILIGVETILQNQLLRIDLTSLGAASGFIVQGDTDNDAAGWSVSEAGDVNGDGFGDLVVGAPLNGNGGPGAGEAYVVFGSDAGFGIDVGGRQVVDVSSLDPLQGFVIRGDSGGDVAGRSVSAAGDVNGDGFADLIVGAPYGGIGVTTTGEAYVVLGSGDGFGSIIGGRQVVDLSLLAPGQGIIIRGESSLDRTGAGVSTAGDLNGDGFDDFIVGTDTANEAYVVFGSPLNFFVDVATLSPLVGFVIQSSTPGSLGFAVSSAGDVNGDGFDDLIVGDHRNDDGGGDAGAAYVLFGTAGAFGSAIGGRQVVDVTGLAASQGFVIQGDAAGDIAGFSVSAAGDVNGDGYDDVIVGARYGDEGGSMSGQGYVVFGSGGTFGTNVAGRQVIDLDTLSALQGFLIQGDEAGDEAGTSVSAAGDINGDGFGDLIVGAPRSGDDGDDSGEVFVVFGSNDGFGTNIAGRQVIDLSSLAPSVGFSIVGDTAGDQAGTSVSAAGDVNGDGFADLILGARGGSDGGSYAGEAYVLFGGPFGAGAPVTLNGGAGSNDILIGGHAADSLFGGGLHDIFRAGAGNDLIGIGDALFSDIDGGTGSDTLSLTGGGHTLDLAALLPAEIHSIEHIDLGGSGNNTLAIDRFAILDLTEERTGGTAILRVEGNAGDSVQLTDPFWQNLGTTIESGVTFDRYVLDNAEVRIEQGLNVQVQPGIDLEFLTTAQGFVIIGDTDFDFAGIGVGSGDVNGDGYDDLLLGAPFAGASGEGYVVFGSPDGFGTEIDGLQVIDLASLGSAEGFVIQGSVPSGLTAFSISSAGDVNGDGLADIILGANGGNSAAPGEAYVIFGSTGTFGTAIGGRQVIEIATLTAAQGFVLQGDTAGDSAGFGVSTAGDINGDGFDELIVGAFQGDDGGISAGEAYVLFGSPGAFGTNIGGRQVIDFTTLGSSQGFIVQGDTAGDNLGLAVASAGDINGDGLDELVVSALNGDDGGSGAGEAYVVFGTTVGFGSDVGGRRVIDLTTLTSSQGFILQGDASGDAAGISVATAGDINGDGFDDLVIGAWFGDDGGLDSGQAYVVFGSGGTFGSNIGGRQVIDLDTLGSSQGFVIVGVNNFDSVGYDVSSAGDVNGDGFGDILVGSFSTYNGGPGAGGAYLIFGSGAGFGSSVGGRQVIDLASLGTAQGLAIRGAAAYDRAGWSVSAGDINGDGFADLMVGAPYSDLGGNTAGAVYVLFGASADPGVSVTLSGTSGVNTLIGDSAADTLFGGGGFDVLRGGAGNDLLGIGNTPFADIDGGSGDDTLAITGGGQTLDLAILHPAELRSVERIDLTGSDNNTLVIDYFAALDLTEERSGGMAIIHVEGNAGDTVQLLGLGWSPAGSTFEGGITFARFVLGAAEIRIEQVLTVDAVPTTIDLSALPPHEGFIIQGVAAGDAAGGSVASAGDVNGDGYDDLIVGAVFGNLSGPGVGAAYVVFGGPEVPGESNVLDLESLAAPHGFVIHDGSDQSGLGVDVASAGDVNGDGFDDVIVGADFGDGSGPNVGVAYVVFGTSGAFGTSVGGQQVIDITTLLPSQGFVIFGFATSDALGRSVSGAGDLNGDGFDDLIVGAPFGDFLGEEVGTAYVVFGTSNAFGVEVGGRQVINVGVVDTSRWSVVTGDSLGDVAGLAVSSAGDVNGDGLDDILVGAPGGDDGGIGAGEAYVIFGTTGPFGSIIVQHRQFDLSTLTAAEGFIIQGDATLDNNGFAVSAAGDVNGDGFDDVIVGASGASASNEGEAYVVFGSGGAVGTIVGGRQVVDITALAPTRGFVIRGDTTNDYAGYSVSTAGDVNGDGFADLLVGAFFADLAGNMAGQTYVLFGSNTPFGVSIGGRQVVDLSSLTPSQGFMILGDAAGDTAGRSVSAAGDIDGDGFDDLIVGARLGDDGGDAAGEAYVLFGSMFGLALPVASFGGGGAETLIGDRLNDTLFGGGGLDVLRGGAGNDLLGIGGLPFADIDGGTGMDTLSLTGAGLTLNLATALPAEIRSIERIDLTGSGNNTLAIDRFAALDLTEERVSGSAIIHVEGNGGDVVQLVDRGWSFIGSTVEGAVTFDRFVIAGAELRIEQGLTVQSLQPGIDLTWLDSEQGFVIQGDVAADHAGHSVSSVGDINGDGFADLIVGAPDHDYGGSNAGTAFVVFGSGQGFGSPVGGRQVIDLSSLGSGQGFLVVGDVSFDYAGRSVAAAGDLNGDGFGDIVIGAPYNGNAGGEAGEAYVIFGSAGTFGSSILGRQMIEVAALTSAEGFVIRGDDLNDHAGHRVVNAGDVNGDGYDDLMVGAPGAADDSGETYVIFGSGGTFGIAEGSRQVIDLTTLGSAQGFIIRGGTYDYSARSVSSAGDLNGDGFDDMIVGAPYAGFFGAAPEAYVVFGSSGTFGSNVAGRQVIDLDALGSTQGFVILADQAYDRTGYSVSSAGDIDGDGFDDLVVSTPFGGGYAGRAYVLFGGNGTFGTPDGGRQVIDLTTLGSAQGFVIAGGANSYAGYSVSRAGDINGDGFDDLIVGAPGGSTGGFQSGQAYVLFGSAGTFGSAVGGRQVVDLTSLTTSQGFLVQGDIGGDAAGFSVSAAGDVNGDGFDDLMVGAPYGSDGGANAGEAYVVFGGPAGAAVPVVQSGSGAADTLVGGRLADTLTGNGGADVLRGGAGNDQLSIGDNTFADIDGGTGIDTLALAGNAMTLNLATEQPAEIASIERIDMGGTGNDVLVLDELAFFDLTEERGLGTPAVAVRGDAGDAVQIDIGGSETWTLVGSAALDGVSYNRYQFDEDGGGAIAPMANAELWLDQDLALSFI